MQVMGTPAQAAPACRPVCRSLLWKVVDIPTWAITRAKGRGSLRRRVAERGLRPAASGETTRVERTRQGAL